MALIGSVLDFTITDVLQLIKMQRKDGLLEVYSRDETVTVWFRNGNVIWAESSLRPMVPSVCKWLLRKGALSEAHMSTVQVRMEAGGVKFDEVLTEVARVPEPVWKPMVEHYMKETVYGLFRWLEGDYTFETEVELNIPVASEPKSINTDDVLMDTAVRSDEWPYIQDRVPSLVIVYGRKADARLADDANEEERYVFGRINGEQNVETIVDSSPHGAFQTLRAMANLVEKGMLDNLGEHDPRAEARAQEREEAVRKEQLGKPERPGNPGRAQSTGLALLCASLVLGCGWLFYAQAAEPPRDLSSGFIESMATYKEYKVRQAISSYRLLHGGFPDSLSALQAQGYLPESMDFGGLTYELEENGFSLHAG
ncbi:MAG: DUF4388 domain-containing protein [Nitrospirota bacterium]|nr:DUF4388 domain-containing protein [Nitrospirota bacterium]